MQYIILGLMVAAALTRPKIFGGKEVGFGAIGIAGVVASVVTGGVPSALVWETTASMVPAVLTIASLMLFVGACRSVGLLDRITSLIVRSSRGSSRRLMSLLFWIGAGFGALFTNDAAILLLTPLTIQLCKNRKGEHSDQDHLPFLFAVLYIGNLVGTLVISNPINIIAASYFDIPFLTYFFWMALPAFVSMLVTWMGLMIFFRRELRAKPDFIVDASLDISEDKRTKVRHQWIVGGLLFVVLTFFTLEQITGFPIWIVAVTGAVITCTYAYAVTRKARVITSRVDIPILVFMTAVAIVAVAVRNAGLTDEVADVSRQLLDTSTELSILGMSFLSAVVAAVINNHSTVSLMIWVVEDLALEQNLEQAIVMASLIGADLGPKMLPVGSLAAMMWLRMLAASGIEFKLWTYVKVGIPVTLLGVAASSLLLVIEHSLLG